MRFTANINIEMPDEMFEHIIKTAGVQIQHDSDRHSIVLAAATRQLPIALREYLLAPERGPVVFGVPVLFSTPDSEAQLSVTFMETPDV